MGRVFFQKTHSFIREKIPPELAALTGAAAGTGLAGDFWLTGILFVLSVFFSKVRRRIFLVFLLLAATSALIRRIPSNPLLRVPRRVEVQLRVTDSGLSRLRESTLPGWTEAEVTTLSLLSGGQAPAVRKILMRFPMNYAGHPIAGDAFFAEGILEAVPEHLSSYAAIRRADALFLADTLRPAEPVRHWRDFPVRLREKILPAAVRGLTPDTRKAAAASLFFGVKGGLGRASRAALVQAGVIHLYSVSGLHVGIAAGVLLLLLRGIPSFKLRYGLLISGTLVYVLSTGANVPAVRAWLMIAVWAGCRATLRRIPGTRILGYTAACLLVWQTAWLHDMGFLYSFVMTAVLLLTGQNLLAVRKYLAFPEMLTPFSQRKPLQRHLVRFQAGAADAVIISLAALLGGAVIGLGFQQRFLPGSAVANFLLIPVVGLLFPVMVLKLISGVFSSGTDAFFAGIINFLWDVMDGIVDMVSSLFRASVAGQPPGWSCGLFVLGLAGMLFPQLPRKIRIGGAVLTAGMLVVWHTPVFRQSPAVMIAGGGYAEFPAVALADTLAGTGTVLNVPDGEIASAIARFFYAKGIAEVDNVAFSSPQTRNIRGLQSLASRIPVRQITLPPRRRGDGAFRVKAAEFLAEFPRTGISEESGIRYEEKENASWHAFYSNPASGFQAEIQYAAPRSMLTVNGKSFPFPASSVLQTLTAE